MAQVTQLKEKHQQGIDEIDRIMDFAEKKAQEESRRLGVPNVYCIGGVNH